MIFKIPAYYFYEYLNRNVAKTHTAISFAIKSFIQMERCIFLKLLFVNPNMNLNFSNVFYLKNLQKQVKKALKILLTFHCSNKLF